MGAVARAVGGLAIGAVLRHRTIALQGRVIGFSREEGEQGWPRVETAVRAEVVSPPSAWEIVSGALVDLDTTARTVLLEALGSQIAEYQRAIPALADARQEDAVRIMQERADAARIMVARVRAMGGV